MRQHSNPTTTQPHLSKSIAVVPCLFSSELTLAMNAGYGLGSVASVIHPYPTQAEAIRAAGDLLNKNRLTPTVRAVLRQVLKFQN
mmetsp:Transcript_41525/g.163408  ORF Transcript_41525/g.163408 Transcript_41525/m.163408 type:complete len:85 (+) Transcript_41525:73-327(+)